MKILVAEDETTIANILAANLRHDDFDPIVINTGPAVLEYLQSDKPELILLDVMLPGMDGFEVCRQIRQTSHVPIIMLTAKVSEVDRLKGFEVGADDYVCKPFSPREVVARIKSVIRRATDAPIKTDPIKTNPTVKISGSKQRASEFDILEDELSISLKGKSLDLTSSEFNLLKSFIKNPNRVFERNQLLVMLNQQGSDCTDRAIDCHIKNVRRKLRSILPDENIIQSVYGVGYKLG